MQQILLHRALRAFLLSLFSLSLSVSFTACGDDEEGEISGSSGGQTGGSGDVTSETAVRARLEVPELRADGHTMLVSHFTSESVNGKSTQVMTYALEYDLDKCHARWVAFRFDPVTRKQKVSRQNNFRDDPDLPADYRIGSATFRGYDRGHICASADRLYSAAANSNTFYMSNMSPQIGAFNQGYWVTLEGYVQDQGRSASFSDTLYVVKGGTIRDDQINTYVSRDNGLRVAMPKYYYMALLKVKSGVYSSIAFWMEHKTYTGYDGNRHAPLTEMKKHVVSVNELESLTGIDFFPNLPDAKEESVEGQKVPAAWGL